MVWYYFIANFFDSFVQEFFGFRVHREILLAFHLRLSTGLKIWSYFLLIWCYEFPVVLFSYLLLRYLIYLGMGLILELRFLLSGFALLYFVAFFLWIQSEWFLPLSFISTLSRNKVSSIVRIISFEGILWMLAKL